MEHKEDKLIFDERETGLTGLTPELPDSQASVALKAVQAAIEARREEAASLIGDARHSSQARRRKLLGEAGSLSQTSSQLEAVIDPQPSMQELGEFDSEALQNHLVDRLQRFLPYE